MEKKVDLDLNFSQTFRTSLSEYSNYKGTLLDVASPVVNAQLEFKQLKESELT